jgi:hypothetical protein
MTSKHADFSPGALASQTNNQGTSSSEPPSSGSKTSRLRAEFQPSDYSVVCGRGKDSFNHVGNRRFRILAGMFIERYSQVDSKAAKSAIVSEIITMIRQADGNFCRFQNGAWFEVEDQYAREKVGALLRDLLHTQYRSSAKAKLARRRKTVKKKDNQNQRSDQKRAEGTGDSDDSSTTSGCWGKSKDSLGFEYWLEAPDDFFEIDVF